MSLGLLSMSLLRCFSYWLSYPEMYSSSYLLLLMFRLFDIWKPWLVGLVDRKIHGGVGVMLDDLIAALFVLAIILPLIQVVPEGLILSTYGLLQ